MAGGPARHFASCLLMRWGACLPLVLTALLLVARRCQAAESRLYKPVDVDKLEEVRRLLARPSRPRDAVGRPAL